MPKATKGLKVQAALLHKDRASIEQQETSKGVPSKRTRKKEKEIDRTQRTQRYAWIACANM